LKTQKPRFQHQKRVHERFPIWESRFCHIWINNTVKAEPVNLSYGGAKLKLILPGDVSFSDLPDLLSLKVHILDQDLAVEAIKTHDAGVEGGVRFLRSPEKILELFDSVIDGMRIGANLWGVTTRSLGNGSTQLHLEGIDRTTISMTLGPNAESVPSLRLSYLKSGWEYAVTIKNDHLFTATTSRPELRVAGTDSAACDLIEDQVVRQAFFIMMGIADPALRDQLQRPINLCLAALSQPLI